MPIKVVRGKLVVVGDPGVGKTSLKQMFVSDGREFPKNYNMTLGVDLRAKRCSIPDCEDVVELLIYDCGGLDLYVDCLSQFVMMLQWDQPDLLLVVCDVSAPHSLESVRAWHKVAQSAEWAGGRAAPLAGLLFANKTDLTRRRLVSSESASQLAAQLGLHYMEGSAKDNQGVQEVFSWLAHQLYEDYARSQPGARPSYNSLHKSALRSSLSSSSK